MNKALALIIADSLGEELSGHAAVSARAARMIVRRHISRPDEIDIEPLVREVFLVMGWRRQISDRPGATVWWRRS